MKFASILVKIFTLTSFDIYGIGLIALPGEFSVLLRMQLGYRIRLQKPAIYYTSSTAMLSTHSSVVVVEACPLTSIDP